MGPGAAEVHGAVQRVILWPALLRPQPALCASALRQAGEEAPLQPLGPQVFPELEARPALLLARPAPARPAGVALSWVPPPEVVPLGELPAEQLDEEAVRKGARERSYREPFRHWYRPHPSLFELTPR